MKYLINIIILLISICLFITLGHKAVAQEKAFTIEECVNTFAEDKAVPTKVGYQYWFADKNFLDGRTIKMSVVAPGKSTHEPHQHPEDEFFYVLEGTAKFHLDGKEVVVGENTSLYCPPNIMHGISNVGETELKYLVIKKYDK